jgi:hypothetical protein
VLSADAFVVFGHSVELCVACVLLVGPGCNSAWLSSLAPSVPRSCYRCDVFRTESLQSDYVVYAVFVLSSLCGVSFDIL